MPLEEVTVRATLPRDPGAAGLLAEPLTPGRAPAPVSSVADLAQLQPGIAFAGQGGLLQTVSIRGLSGQQVANFWGETPVLGDRRAGTASSFIDPVMLGSVAILQGPATVFYGSGAGAGVLQFSPARPAGLEAALQWGSHGDENLQYLGFGGESVSLAVSRRSADDGSAGGGERLHDRFDQYNAQFQWQASHNGASLAFNQLVSAGRDIGKSNNLYPDRITDYPEERHWLGEFSINVEDRLSASTYYHYQSLDTRVEQVGESISDLSSESLDFGFRLAWHLDHLRSGIEYLGRRNVKADEREVLLDSGETLASRQLDAEQDGVDLFVDSETRLGPVNLSGGLRWSWIEQRDGSSIDDTALAGFLRAGMEPLPGLTLQLDLSSGARFPGLGELFFSGITGRGQVLGNAQLDPEQTLGLDLGIGWTGDRLSVELRGFATRIDDYIERVDITTGVRSFRNLTKGELTGLEGIGEVLLTEAFTLRFGGHYIDSEDDDGHRLPNVAAPQVFAELSGHRGPWQGSIRLGYRFSEGDVAPTEVPLDSARILSASLTRQWGLLGISVWGRNLLDDDWRLASDELATGAPERSLGVTLSWRAQPG
jgi:iron complex outermembrane receptor protein